MMLLMVFAQHFLFLLLRSVINHFKWKGLWFKLHLIIAQQITNFDRFMNAG